MYQQLFNLFRIDLFLPLLCLRYISLQYIIAFLHNGMSCWALPKQWFSILYWMCFTLLHLFRLCQQLHLLHHRVALKLSMCINLLCGLLRSWNLMYFLQYELYHLHFGSHMYFLPKSTRPVRDQLRHHMPTSHTYHKFSKYVFVMY